MRKIFSLTLLTKWKYVLVYGVITWGIGVGSLFYLIQVAYGVKFDWLFFISTEIAFMFAGLLWGLWNWTYYKEKLEKR